MRTRGSQFASSNNGMLRILWSFALIACFTGASASSLYSQTPKAAEVHGAIYAKVNGQTIIILLPDIRVFVKNMITHQASPAVVTDIDGRYRIPPQPPGRYEVCWDAVGWTPGCDDHVFSINGTTQYPEPIGIMPDVTSEAVRAIPGRVTLKDGSPCTFVNEFLSISETARVSAIDGNGAELTRPIRADRGGFFVLTRVPPQAASVRATCEGASATRALFSPIGTVPISAHLELVISNSRPTVMTVVATDGGKGVRMVAEGTVVDLSATAVDPDKDNLVFKWVVPHGSGKILSSAGSSAKWETPKDKGRHTAYVMVTDEKGGVTQGSVSLQVGETEILFSGKVIGSNGPALPKATVMANGVTTTTDTHGAFALNVPAVKDNRYVVTVSKVGYAAASRIFDSGASGTIWKLTRATNLPLNPATGGKFFDERSLVVRVPTEGGKYRTTKMSGATVNLKPNTLVDSHGKPAKKPLRMSLTTVNLSTDPLPGDYGAIDSTGQETNLLSFGAASIEIRDAQGKPYNLASGSTAQIILPIHPAHLANAASPPPTTIPLWTYDEKTGYWKEEGVAKRAGTNYVAEVKHFSYNNTDLSKQTASCMRVNVAQGSNLLGLKVKLSSAAFPQTFELLLDNQINAYYRLIPNTNITLQVEDSNGNIMPNIAMFDAAHNLIPGNSVNTGAALPAGQTLWPPYPYTPCGVEVNLEQTIPPWSGAPGSPFLTFKGEISDAETNAYYAVIDPNSNRTTLGGWWGQNGFDAVTGANGTRTAYLNNNDLGFGRDMHCLQTGADIACYVTNYGHPDQDPANADLAQTADKTKAVATVCMEWKAVDGQPANNRIVKFFIFQGGSANGGRLTAADLDGFGGKHAPNLCNVCHGGNYQPANSLAPTLAEVNTGASFREFDLTSLKYPAANPQALQEANFKVLNQIVAASAPAGAITDLVNGWYAGNSATQITTYVPTGWTATPQKHDLYANVVAKSCRTCHVAQDAVSNNSVISWLNYSMFQQKRGTIQAFVCGANKLMPQALVTYKNFWLSTTPSSPQALGTFSANDWASFGGCQ